MSSEVPAAGALAGVRVVDLSARLPGPLATLFLAAAGAEVTRVEPPGGDVMRRADGVWPQAPAAFALLHAGKRCIELDLKDPAGYDALIGLVRESDVVVDGFRPAVARRLGLDHATLARHAPRIITCSIVGYDPDGPDAARAGHDLTYLAERGVLALLRTHDGVPALPGVLLADVGGGSYPAVVNILLALYARERTGHGAHLDVPLADALAPFTLWARATAAGGGSLDVARGVFTGGSPRYGCYRTADGAWLAVGALEPHFWRAFCATLAIDESADVAAVAAAVARHDAAWFARLREVDTCAAFVAPVAAAAGEGTLPLPLAAAVRADPDGASSAAKDTRP
ncbi:MAG TPA: CaiB/BaiF CoA-transferase family protein [Candidatus Sulfotelmatobacter sp.]|nr:CaiB/BaiF CoA-transferase family protein [Candidatus Sulfotelmatobacter sp.]